MTAYTTMKRGDTAPPLRVTITAEGDDGEVGPVDLTGATIRCLGSNESGDLVVDRAPASATAEGALTMEWQTDDTAVTGRLRFEFEVTQGGKVQTFPADGYVEVEILADLG